MTFSPVSLCLFTLDSLILIVIVYLQSTSLFILDISTCNPNNSPLPLIFPIIYSYNAHITYIILLYSHITYNIFLSTHIPYNILLKHLYKIYYTTIHPYSFQYRYIPIHSYKIYYTPIRFIICILYYYNIYIPYSKTYFNILTVIDVTNCNILAIIDASFTVS